MAAVGMALDDHAGVNSPRRVQGDQDDAHSSRRLDTIMSLDEYVDFESEFAVAALKQLAEVVQSLTAEHNRQMSHLRKENEDMHSKLQASPVGKHTEKKVEQGKPVNSQGHDASASSSSSPHNGSRNEPQPPDSNKEVSEVHLSDAEPEDADDEHLEGYEDHREAGFRKKMHRFVLSTKFDSVIGAVIMGNTLVMSLQLEYNGRVFKDEVLDKCTQCDVKSDGMEWFFMGMEHVFTGIFTLELVLRLLFIGIGYLKSPSNFLDAIIVLVSMADSWVLGPMGSSVLGSVAVLRLIRLLRLAKILRVVRVMKAFKSLRVLVAAVVNSVGALAWSMTLLFVLELIGAIFMAQVLKPFMEDSTGTVEAEDLQVFIFDNFGTWTNSMFTIFEITMAPGGFIKYRRLYQEVHPLFGMFFVIYVCIVTFAVVRVITAMFLKATLSASDSEEQNEAHEQSNRWGAHMKFVKGMEDMKGPINMDLTTLSFKELEELLSIEQVTKWMGDVGIVASEIKRMFHVLQGSNKEILFCEFEHALRQMTGSPRAANSILNLYETRDVLHRVIQLESKLSAVN